MISDSCHSGGLIDQEKEQIGPSVDGGDIAAPPSTTRRRFLPYGAVVGHLSAISGVDASHHVAEHLLALFGDDASANSAVQAVLAAAQPEAAVAVSNREVVIRARKVLAEKGFQQHPCLYCSDANADAPFLYATSFDVVCDQLGLVRSEFPHTFYGVAGTQAEKAAWNYIGVFKLSNISGKKREPVPASAVDGDTDMDSDSSSDEEDEEINEDTKPILHVWDLSSFLNSLAESGSATPAPKEDDIIHKHLPVKVFSGHQKEGYAIDWSPLVTGRLVSGACNKCIHLWEPTPNSWNVDANPFVGHSASVEDLQWSPTEADVFASCSVDGTIAIWDIRKGKKPCISIEAHKDDVNVISWNRLASSMIASGSDDGSFSVHDLRSIKMDRSPKMFYPVFTDTSHGLSAFRIWDLSLEKDAEEEAEFRAKMKEQANAPEDLPPQLLFIHQGQRDLKELHWHPQIPSLIISTAVDGFNVLMPSNIGTTIPGDTDAAMASAEP
ncbi:hypothetical protein HU200_030739 [Digitaria exilis]|uniref:Histone-binding protein RBBP4 N-terminal domain-containing protein n=1 Tax=Digitaria exilis TaxID=1010633 RepID=A0A835EQU7_9POAL|nr:hypothetical protein HU200_030739 [Digitaria exilis]